MNFLKLPVWYKILVSGLHVFHVMNFENWFKIFAVFSNTTFKTEKYLFWSHLNVSVIEMGQSMEFLNGCENALLTVTKSKKRY